MKHGSNQRRGRSRGGNGGKRHQSSRNQAHDSNGPEGKVRGSAQQIHDKYTSLARDAASAGEHITAEGFYQFAEHYYRVANADGANSQNQNRSQQGAQQQDSQQQDAKPQDEQKNDETAAVESVQAGNAGVDETPDEQPKRRRNNKKVAIGSDASDAAINLEVEADVQAEGVSDNESSQSENTENPDDSDLAASA